MHDEGLVEQSFQRGSLSVKLKIPKSAKTSAASDKGDDPAKEADEITRVIVGLFDRLMGPLVTQMGDLALGVFAGSAAGGSTVGLGMAGRRLRSRQASRPRFRSAPLSVSPQQSPPRCSPIGWRSR